jgi:hypothetical protein
MKIKRRKLLSGSAGVAAAATYLPITSDLANAQAARTLIVASGGTPEGLDGDALKGNAGGDVLRRADAMHEQGLGERREYGHARVERGVRVLEDHL